MEMNSLAQLLVGHNRPVVQPTVAPAPSQAFNAPDQVSQSPAYQMHVAQARQAGQVPLSPAQFMQRLRG